MKIIIGIKTSSLIFDERLTKEVNSLIDVGNLNISLHVVEDQISKVQFDEVEVNRINSNIDFLGVWVSKIFSLFALLLSISLTKVQKKKDIIWLHDPICMFLIPLLSFKCNKLIWDLHEMPPSKFLEIGVLKRFFRFCSRFTKVIIVANQERGEYLKNLGLISDFKVLENFPSKNIDTDNNYSDNEFEEWEIGKSFAYCQSATHPSRNFFALAKSCIEAKQNLLVVGEKNFIYENVRGELANFDTYIKVIGKKKSHLLPYYMKKAKFSIVLYSNENLNNYYCAPNRLYHSLNFGIPVIVGANPTMKNVVNINKCGIVLDSFGEIVEENVRGIGSINENYSYFKKNAETVAGKFFWESQIEIINDIVDLA